MGRHTPADDSTLYCPHCGAAATADHDYCIHCGGDLAPLHEVAATESGTRPPPDHHHSGHSEDEPAGPDWFREQVDYLVGNGWELDRDDGDEVTLVDRGFGSLEGHALLFVFTGGLGNLLYASHHYSVTPQRVTLQAGDDTTEIVRPPERRTGLSDIGWAFASLVGIPLGFAFLLSAGVGVVPALLGSVSTLLSLAAVGPLQRRLEDRYPVTTVGPRESVDERYVTDTDVPCTVCGARVQAGLRKEYRREQVLAGVPLYTTDAGENYYCQECATARIEETASADGATRIAVDGRDTVERELEQLREQSGDSPQDRAECSETERSGP